MPQILLTCVALEGSVWLSEEICVVVAEKIRAMRNGCREEIGMHMAGSRHRELL